MSTDDLSRLVGRVSNGAAAWHKLDPRARAARIRACIPGMLAVADEWARLGSLAKGIDPGRALAGEEWLAGPMTAIRGFRLTAESLESLSDTLASRVADGPGGRRIVRVFPASVYDRVIFLGMSGEVWIQPGQEVSRGRIYREDGAQPGVALVLGAGNVSSIGPLDALYMLAAYGQTAVLKLNPVNDYLAPVFARAFAPLIEGGFLAVVSGGPEVADVLVHHPAVTRVHLTGARRTFDAIMWGATEGERRERLAAGAPRVAKPFTAELGCVTPILVVPGPWSDADLDAQARQVAASVAHNASFNCVAGKVLVVARGWDRREAFLARVDAVLRDTPPRRAYYPGAEQRYRAFLAHYPTARPLGAAGAGELPWTILPDVPPGAGEYALSEEAFCGVLAVTTLEADDPVSFLDQAVPFANEAVDGTLSCMLLVHPATARAHADAVARAERDLRYGSIGVNLWSGVVFGVGTTTWGAYPGHTAAAAGSGIGVVHNSLLLDAPEKSIVRAPFRLWPKPVWFADHRTLDVIGRRMTAFEASPGWAKLPAIFAAALRG